MKLPVKVLVLAAVAAPIFGVPAHAAVDLSVLPQSCQDGLAFIASDKPQYASLGAAMIKARKAKDTGNFCTSARQIIQLIKGESDKMDDCAGDLAGAKDVPVSLSNQLLGIKAQYKQMLEQAKVEKNDRFKCGLASE